MKKNIIFYASFGKGLPPEKIGGAEAGCLKTVDILTKAGYNVIKLDKPVKKQSVLLYLLETVYTYIKFIRLLQKKDTCLHVAGFYRGIIYIEYLYIITAKIFKKKAIYEIRNGGMIEEFQERGYIYKRTMLAALKNSSIILCQGAEYMPFIKDKIKKESFWYPNYIMDSFIGSSVPIRDCKELRLVYFGRITEAKNIDIIIKTTDTLNNKGINVILDLIGGYSKEYKTILDSLIENSSLANEQVRFHGRQSMEYFAPILRNSHFFIFPSSEKREGHSNSLTEAMGCGLVPVASTAGFNSSIAGNSNFIIDSLNASEYAVTIEDIWKSKNWEKYSEECFIRIRDNFTESIVREKLLTAYLKL